MSSPSIWTEAAAGRGSAGGCCARGPADTATIKATIAMPDALVAIFIPRMVTPTTFSFFVSNDNHGTAR